MTYYHFTITGTVQGVGFRPYIFNACKKARLTGSVQNIGTGVAVIINNKDALNKILENIPPNARIDSITIKEIDSIHTDFEIIESTGKGFSEIPADLNLCNDCHEDLFDEENRRYGYFFTTCTNCGPRFTIANRSPYDRETTTMCAFPMCEQCTKEYQDPTNRRYHAQTIACPDCGPHLKLHCGTKIIGSSAVKALNTTRELLETGEIIAIKGIGGFHLVCNTDAQTIKKLKELTRRTNKPFALMCRDLAMAHTIATPTKEEEALLTSQTRPIVLVEKKNGDRNISELDSVGIMLPYSALHELLFVSYDKPLIMTSANLSGAPITTQREQQFTTYVLDHSRVIANATDDSLMKVVGKIPLFIRRSRGYVPQSIPISTKETKQILALGAEMNSTFALYKNGRITPSQYLGNTSHPDTFEHYKETVRAFLSYTKSTPDIILADLHPSYNTSLYAQELSGELGIPCEHIQHHRAHAAGVAAEHNLKYSTAIVCDGMGYGDDGTIWGGEIFVDDERIGHLENHKLLGGDNAARDPRKMLFSILKNFMSTDEIAILLQDSVVAPIGATISQRDLSILSTQWDDNFNAPLTSSCGRVLDAASALLGFCRERTYDGRPAMLLEAHSTKAYKLSPVVKDNVLMTTPLFEYLVKNITKDKFRLAATVQQYITEGLFTIAKHYNHPITFSGGCSYNRIMSEYMISQGVLLNKKTPPGDGGIAFGQIAHYLKEWDARRK